MGNGFPDVRNVRHAMFSGSIFHRLLEEFMSLSIPTINLNVNSAGYINTAYPTVSGTADPLTTIEILNNNGPTPLGTTTSDANGNWHWTETTALYNGIPYQLTAEAVDSAGHQLATSSAISFRVDTVAPAAPVFASDAVNGVNSYGYAPYLVHQIRRIIWSPVLSWVAGAQRWLPL